MTMLTDQDCKTIIARRDRRYDGRFYFGVKTTRIYCRPVCPARPKPENILIFRSASEAEKKGYRPCLRCRPDAAPGSKLLDGTRNTVTRALRIIQDHGGDELDIEKLAATLGVTDRHLRRLFDEQLGASPIEILITQRLHFAKQVLQESKTPIATLAFAAGFQSVRRFNEAFKSRYQQTPTALRAAKSPQSTDGGLVLRLPIRLPYDLESVLAYLARHAAAGIERVSNGVYRRYLPHEQGFGFVDVTAASKHDFLIARFFEVPLGSIRGILERLKTLFDTDHNPSDLPDTELMHRGIRVPTSFDPFEAAISIILAQLVSTEAARTKLGTVVSRFGRPLGVHESQAIFAFPTPSQLAEAPIEEIGIPRVKAGAIRGLAQAVVSGVVDFGAHGELSETVAVLLRIRGIGPWTATMIAMRCLGDADAFPSGDLIVQRALAQNLVDETPWMTARAYLTHCLWRDLADTLSKTKGPKT